eukprot:15010881-Heterocapsa_arctica.AAC.1
MTLIKATPKGGMLKRKAVNDEHKESAQGDSQGDHIDRRQAPDAMQGGKGYQNPGAMMGKGGYQ